MCCVGCLASGGGLRLSGKISKFFENARREFGAVGERNSRERHALRSGALKHLNPSKEDPMQRMTRGPGCLRVTA